MKPLLSWIGVAALFAWTAGGAAAWLATKDHIALSIASGAPERAPADDPAALLAADVAALRADLSALASTLGPNLELLDRRGEERSDAAARELAALRVELARIQGANEGALLAEVRALWRGERPAFGGLPTTGTFALCRQPIYFGFALTLWTGPVWTIDHLVVALVWSAYCLVGPLAKERRFASHYGGDFARYRARTPYFFPRLFV